MIYETLSCVADEINDYFKLSFHLTESKVVLSGIINQDGTTGVQGENKILITLVNIEKENLGSLVNTKQRGKSGSGSGFLTTNLYVLFSAYFSTNNYAESLRFISFVMTFLQNKNEFSRSNTPRLHSSIDRLSFDIENLGFDKLNNMWTTLGAKYMPSVLYKVRMVTSSQNI